MRPLPKLPFPTSPLRLFSSSSSSSPPLLSVGHKLRGSRRFTAQDLVKYSEVTGDFNPVHLSDEAARSAAGFERGRVVHGMLVASLFPSVVARSFPGAIYVSQNLKFKLPVYIEDEVHAELETTHIKEIKKRYIVKFTTRCFTNGDQLVIDGEAMTVLPTLTLNK